jgi:hypothetical protein
MWLLAGQVKRFFFLDNADMTGAACDLMTPGLGQWPPSLSIDLGHGVIPLASVTACERGTNEELNLMEQHHRQ